MILGTAGHIDHGKTSLVRALTGVDTDRLPEEKKRGITIELGFAPLTLASAEFTGTLGIVDVPGHDAFVRTMLAGATGVDLALLVIAADEGVMPQTREHLAILTLLGVRGGVVALTKSDLVDAEWLALVREDVRALLADSALDGADIIACSAATGAGLDDLRGALAAAAARVPARSTDDLTRLPLDRAFSLKGTGTVITGTLWSGALDREMHATVFPGALPARVRSIESHGSAVDRGLPGTRVAVALGGVDREQVSHGGVLVADDAGWRETAVLRADVALLDGAPSLGVRTRVRFHLGTSDVGARLVSAAGRVEPGAVHAVRIALDAPIVTRAGDRFVLRATSPAMTIGGGVVSDPHPPARRAKAWSSTSASAATRLEWIAMESAGEGFAVADIPVRVGIAPRDVDALASATRAITRIGDDLYHTGLIARLRDRLASDVRAWHKANPLEAGLPLQHARSKLHASESLFEQIVGDLVKRGKIEVRGAVLTRAGWKAGAGADATKLAELATAIEAGGVSPLSVDELADQFGKETPALLRVLEREGRAVAVASDRYYSPKALESLLASLRAVTADGLQKTASQIRESLGLSRKYLIPFLEYCDRIGVSARHGDLRSFHWKP
ncbi:MAG TPA: selenocysteine-specific translation elongation factor [Gemmatimonadaceae bacterium]|nr:selenocysteine-specific translation elongation factor [Gemmatimonadaceae bacterium]